jgi:hypothetical protein
MQVDIPRYLWTDTRYVKDRNNPLLYRAATKTYDPETHAVSPFRFDVSFEGSGVSPAIARSMVALSEMGMVSAAGLLSLVDTAEEYRSRYNANPRFRIFSNYFSEMTGVKKGEFRPTGHLFGMLTGGFLRKIYKDDINMFDILDAHCRQPELEITDRFVGFYRGLRKTAVVKAQLLVPEIRVDNPGTYIDAKVADLLTEQDKGFIRALELLEGFARVYKDPKNEKIFNSVSDFTPQVRYDLFALYCGEIAVGVDFLNSRRVDTGRRKILTHEHSGAQEMGVCTIQTGDSDIKREMIRIPGADLEYSFRCPFFTEQGWIDTQLRRTDL